MLIHDLVSNYCETNPVLIICEVQPKEMGLPVQAYAAQDEIREDGTQKAQKVFVNLPTEVGATEAEEIGVEHLLRDVKDVTTSTLSSEVGDLVVGLKGLRARLKELETYLSYVLEGKLPINHDVMRNLQDIFNLLPNLNVAQLSNSLAVESNDMMMVVYLASLVRSVIALHALIDNREERKAREMESVAKTKEKEKEKEKEKQKEKQKDGANAATAAATSNQKDPDTPMD
jgi:26S proteasome regulatory subunit N8